MKLFNFFTKKFKGGPDFNKNRSYLFLLDNIKLNITLPVSNINTTESPREVNIPFNRLDFFEQNSERERQHEALKIYTELWHYLPNIGIGSSSELGMLACTLMIKKVQDATCINAMKLDQLSKSVIDEYNQHYNHSVIADHGQGSNTRIRQEVHEESSNRNTPWTKKETEDEIEVSINKYGYPPLSPAKQVLINNKSWVFYQEARSIVRNKDNFYCYPLDELYYLCIRFRYRIDIQDKFKLWEEHSEIAERNIMDNLSIVFIRGC